MPSTPPIASIEWLETPTLRKWFARWLIAQWDYLYGGLGNPLMGQAYRAMATRMKRLAPSLPWMTTREQIKAVNTAAKQHGSATIRNRVLEVLRSHLERYGNRPENQEALKASAWCNVFALRQHQLKERGEMLVGKHYSWGKELELCLALQKLLGIFSALEIWPSAATPTRERREQRALFRAIRIALGAPSSNDQKPKREALTPRELAARLVHLFRDVWPRHPQPVILLGLNSDFDPRQLAPPSDLALVSRHRGKLSKTDRALPELWRLLNLPGSPAKSCRSPWRDDHNPSFSVFDDGQRWRDFAADEGGDAIDFLARARGLSNSDACREFIKLAGITPPPPQHSTLNPQSSFDWPACVAALTPERRARLSAHTHRVNRVGGEG